MLNMIKKERGFTLVELMVVILIIAILLAVAIPVFLQARSRAVNRAAQSRLERAVKAAKTLRGGGTSSDVSEAVAGTPYNDAAMTAAAIQAEAGGVAVVAEDGTYTNAAIDYAGTGADTATFRTLDGDGDTWLATINGSNVTYAES